MFNFAFLNRAKTTHSLSLDTQSRCLRQLETELQQAARECGLRLQSCQRLSRPTADTADKSWRLRVQFQAHSKQADRFMQNVMGRTESLPLRRVRLERSHRELPTPTPRQRIS